MVRRSTWIVLGLFVLLVGFTLLFQRYQANKSAYTATTTPTIAPVYLFNLGDARVDEIKIDDSTGKNIDLKRDSASSSWSIVGTPADQADSSSIESMSTQLISIKVQETLTETLPLASIGLEPATYTITVTTSTGSQLVTYVGAQTAIGSGYYIRNDTGQLMIVDKTSMDDILNLLKNPPLLPTATPTNTPTELTSPTPPADQATPTP